MLLLRCNIGSETKLEISVDGRTRTRVTHSNIFSYFAAAVARIVTVLCEFLRHSTISFMNIRVFLDLCVILTATVHIRG